MSQSISVRLPDQTKDELDRFVSERGLTRSEAVRGAIKEYLFARRLRELRRRLLPYAEEQGIYTDEDVFREIS